MDMSETKNTPRYTIKHFEERTNFRGATVAAQWVIMDGEEAAAYHNSSKEIFTDWEAQRKADALNAKHTPATTPAAETATEAQINYLTSLLPRFYAAQKEDGITLETAVWASSGALKAEAIRTLTKEAASSWISAAKAEIA